MAMANAPFTVRLASNIAKHGPLCVGIDPSPALLERCGLPDHAESALALGQRVLEAADFKISIIKPQSAYFERYGSAGILALEQLIALARAHDVLVLLDAKRGDIDTTALAYAEAYFSPLSPMRVDALTWHAYLGITALQPAFDYMVKHQGGAFVVVRSSNPEGNALQSAQHKDGHSVSCCLADTLNQINQNYGYTNTLGPLGAVIGATCEDAEMLCSRLPHSYILAPGVGAQGATIKTLSLRLKQSNNRVLPNVSRGLFESGHSKSALSQTLLGLKKECDFLYKS